MSRKAIRRIAPTCKQNSTIRRSSLKKYTIFSVLAVLLVAVLVFSGCGVVGQTGQQGAVGLTGPAGPAGECDCEVAVAAPAQLVFLSDECPIPGETEFIIFGSGFKADATVTLYFAGESTAKQVKWFKADTNEVGAFYAVEVLPSYSEFNQDIFKDVTPIDCEKVDCVCADTVALTVGAYVGSSLVTTYPMLVVDTDGD
ncbi:hypothetical protein MUP77_17545 [Candidatus Bathyarchaeota archaeon]|nr:hypothetical protein [Candidatus Bathyarchaeota archaeon]